MNYRFDLDEWLPRFPLKPRNGRFTGEIITSPCDICNNEHLRWAAYDQFDWGPAVPVDIFIMADGEPNNRHATKIGGLPYRPARMEWPTSLDGTPMSFLAQIDFADSTDLVGELPGDVLLVFTPDTEGCCIETLHFEWQPLGLSDLISGTLFPSRNCVTILAMDICAEPSAILTHGEPRSLPPRSTRCAEVARFGVRIIYISTKPRRSAQHLSSSSKAMMIFRVACCVPSAPYNLTSTSPIRGSITQSH